MGNGIFRSGPVFNLLADGRQTATVSNLKEKYRHVVQEGDDVDVEAVVSASPGPNKADEPVTEQVEEVVARKMNQGMSLAEIETHPIDRGSRQVVVLVFTE